MGEKWQRPVHLLEGEAQDGDVLAANSVEHGLDDTPHKPLLLIVVDLYHLWGDRILASSDRDVLRTEQCLQSISLDQSRSVRWRRDCDILWQGGATPNENCD